MHHQAASYSNREVIRATFKSLFSKHIQIMVVASLLFTWASKKLRLKKLPATRLAATFFGALWVLFYQFQVRETPTLRFQRTATNIKLVDRGRLFRRFKC